MGLGAGHNRSIRFAAFEVDRDGLIVGWSVAAERMFGQALAEMTDRRISSLLDDADPVCQFLALADSSGRAELTQQVVCRKKNGETFHASVLLTVLERIDGGAQRVAVLIVDEERERNRDRLLASVAHDLRQPISLIEASAHLLEKQPGATQKWLAHIKTAARQLSDLSTELLDLGTARLGGEMVLEREPVNLLEVVDEVCDGLQISQSDRLISIEGADAATGHWDRKRLRRLAQNLVENALTHSPPGTSIRILCQRLRADVVLTVENECSERPVALLEDLFEPFRRADERGRAGLGLYIARELARAHGGDVAASWSHGTITFALSLPIVVANRQLEAPAAATPTPLFATQRRHRRFPLDSELEIGARDQRFRAQGRDVSLRGLAFFSEVALDVDERIEVGVSMGSTSFRVLGTVRHVHRQTGGSLVGIEFPCDLSLADIELLHSSR